MAVVSSITVVVSNSTDAHGLVSLRMSVVTFVITTGLSAVSVGSAFVPCSRR